MQTLVLLCMLSALVKASPVKHIVGGAPVDIGDYPFQGSYQNSGSHYCGCALIGSQYVITAAHCGGSSAYSLEFGSSNRGSGEVYAIQSIIFHPEHGQGPGWESNDITLVISSATIITGPNVQPASIPPNAITPTGTGWITGWGQLCGEGQGCGQPVALHGANIPILTDDACDAAHGSNFARESMLCVHSGTSGACFGDSGGPMSQNGIVYGLASWVGGMCDPMYPSTYCRVGAFRSWICGLTNNGAVGC